MGVGGKYWLELGVYADKSEEYMLIGVRGKLLIEVMGIC